MGQFRWQSSGFNWINVTVILSLALATVATFRNFIVVYGPVSLRPAISCTETSLDAGQICGQPQYKFEFTVQNKGGSPLTISKVLAGCRCLSVASPEFPQVIQAGKSLMISTVMDLKGVTGDFRKPVLVYSDDPQQPRLQLSVQGEVCTRRRQIRSSVRS